MAARSLDGCANGVIDTRNFGKVNPVLTLALPSHTHVLVEFHTHQHKAGLLVPCQSNWELRGLVQNINYLNITMNNVRMPIQLYGYYNSVGTPSGVSPASAAAQPLVALTNKISHPTDSSLRPRSHHDDLENRNHRAANRVLTVAAKCRCRAAKSLLF